MSKKITLFLVLAAMLLPATLRAQLLTQDYFYQTGVDTSLWMEAPATATQIIAPGAGDYGYSSVQNIGFNFAFAQQTYSQFSINTDGTLRFGPTVVSTSYYSSPLGSNLNYDLPKITAMGCDGYMTDNGYCKTWIVGEEGEQIRVIELVTSTYSQGNGGGPQVLPIQIQLHQQESMVRLVYGQYNIAPSVTMQIGFAASSTDLVRIDIANHSFIPLNASTSDYNNANTWPENGRWYSGKYSEDFCHNVENLHIDEFDSVSATITWNTDENASGYIVYLNGTEVESTSDTTYTFDTLTPATFYTMGVRKVCSAGDTSGSVNVRITTSCAIIDNIPWSTSFEDENYNDTPNCWTDLMNGSSSDNYIGVYTSYVRTGSQCLSFNYSRATGSVITLPRFSQPISELQLSFYHRPESHTNTSCGTFQAGYLTNPADPNTFVVMASWSYNSFSSDEYQQDEVLFTNAPDNAVMAFRHIGQQSNWRWQVDDVEVREVPSCIRPMGVNIVAADTASVTLSWIGNADEYAYRVLQNGTEVSNGSVNDTVVTIEELLMNENYTVELYSLCGGDSSYATVFSFYHGYCIPNASSMDNQGISRVQFGENDEEVDNSASLTAAPYYGDFYQMVGGATPGDTLTITLTYATGYTYGTVIWIDWNSNMIFEPGEVVWVGESTNSNPTTLVAQIVIPDTMPQGYYRMRIAGADSYFDNYITNLTTAQNADPCFSSSYSVAHDYTLHVGEPPSCMRPTSITLTEVGTDHLDFTWTASGNEIGWEVNFDSAISIVSTNSFSATGLTENTQYAVTIRSICAPGDTSSYTRLTLQTKCSDITLPYFTDFEELGLLDDLPCWKLLHSSHYTYEEYDNDTPAAWRNSEYAHSGNLTAMFAPTNAAPELASLPMVDHPGNELNVRFWCTGFMFGGTGTFEAGIMTNPYDDGTFVPLLIVPDTTTVITEFEFNTTSLTSSDPVCIAFRSSTTSSRAYLCIDDLEITAFSTCHRPDSLSVSDITSSSVTLNWVIPQSTTPTAYDIRYSYEDTTITINNIPGTATSYTLTGLATGCRISAAIRTICGSEETSWREFGRFTTECGLLDLPYLYTFEQYETLERLDCWTSPTTNTYPRNNVNYPTPAIWKYNLYSYRGDCAMFICPTEAGGDDVYVSPEINFPANALSVSFWTKGFLEGTRGTMQAGIMTDPDDTSTFIPCFTYDTTNTGTMMQYTFNTNQVPVTGHAHVAIRASYLPAGTAIRAFFTVDDLLIDTTAVPSGTYYTLTVGSADNSMGTATANYTGSILSGTSVTATATAADGYTFSHWTANGSTDVLSTNNPYTFNITANTTLTAHFVANVGIETEGQQEEVILFPNPASESTTLSGLKGLSAISVVDVEGREVLSMQTEAESVSIDLNTLSSGTYYVRIEGEQGKSVRKLIVR